MLAAGRRAWAPSSLRPAAPAAARILAAEKTPLRGAARARTMATFNRLMNIDEANPAGNVHGGQLLRFMSDDAGYVAALRHLNKDAKGKFNAALGTVSKTAFHAPVHVGDLVTARAEVLSASAHSLVVHVDLWAESLMTGHRRLTNSTDAIYVALDANEASGLKVSSDKIPHVEHVDHEKEQHGQEVYREHLLARQDETQSAAELKRRFKEEQWTASLGHVLLPTDCAPTNRTAKGGRIIKLMDEVGAVAAWRHSRTNCVTASIETLRFRKPLHLGDLVSLRARPTYASSKSLEVEIIVETASPITGESHIAAHAFFVFVALDENGTAIKLPPLDSYSEEAEARYNERKASQIKNRK